MRKFLFLLALMAFSELQAKVVYMAPDGSDAAAGTIDAPLATLPAAYQQIASGDTIIIRGGRYAITDEQVMKLDKRYAFVFAHSISVPTTSICATSTSSSCH